MKKSVLRGCAAVRQAAVCRAACLFVLIVCGLWVIAMPCVALQTAQQKTESEEIARHFNEAVSLYNQGNYSSALAAYTRCIARVPGYAQGYLNRALCYEKLARYDEAISDMAQAERLGGKFSLLHYTRALIYYQRKDYPAALRDFDRCIALNQPGAPDYDVTLIPYSFAKRGLVYFDQKEYTKAAADFDAVITSAAGTDGLMIEVFANRALTALRMEDAPKAVYHATRSLLLKPTIIAYKIRSEAYRKSGSAEKADADDAEARKLLDAPKKALTDAEEKLKKSTEELAAAEAKKKQQEERAEALKKALAALPKSDQPDEFAEIDRAILVLPKNAELYFRRGKLHHQKKNFDAALRDFEKVIELDPNGATNSGFLVFYERGTTYLDREEWDKAVADLEKHLRRETADVEATLALGRAHQGAGRLPLATVYFTKVIEAKPQDARTYFFRGLTYYKRENYEDALEDFAKLIELRPELPQGWQNRGATYYRLKKYDNAITDYSILIDMDRKNPLHYVARGNCYLQKQEWDNAIADYDRALKIKPDLESAKKLREEALAKKNAKP